MSAIETVELRTLPYQPEGTSASRTYSFRGEEGLSLGRLLMGVCLERAMMLERMSVGTMNRLARNNSQLEATANGKTVKQEFRVNPDFTNRIEIRV